MPEGIATGAAANVLSTLFVPVIQQIDDLIHLAENMESMKSELERVRNIVTDIREDLQSEFSGLAGKRAKCPPNSSTNTQCLCQLTTSLPTVFQLLLPAVSRQKDPTMLTEAEETGFVGSQIQSAQKQLQSWLMEDVNAHVIGVYCMGGVGKTSLLKNIYNNQEVRKFFSVVIWATVSQNVNVFELQDCIAFRIDVDLREISNIDMRKMKLYNKLKEMKFLLVLDDLWEQLNLEELGVESVKAGGSKIVITTRDEKVCRTMRADKWWKMEPLSDTEGWELFRRGAVVQADVEDIANEVAFECIFGSFLLLFSNVTAVEDRGTPMSEASQLRRTLTISRYSAGNLSTHIFGEPAEIAQLDLRVSKSASLTVACLSSTEGASCVGDVAKSKELRNKRMSEIEDVGGGVWERRGAFPTLESLTLFELPVLESLVGSASNMGVMEEGAMARLENLSISACAILKSLPLGMESLKSLKRLFVEREWWDEIVLIADDNMKNYFSKACRDHI
eukprot:Gb_09285 [translate_table: standard]